MKSAHTHITTRYYGWYANRPRGMRRQAEPAMADAPPAIVPAPRLTPTEAARRWAALLQQIFEVDPLAWARDTSATNISPSGANHFVESLVRHIGSTPASSSAPKSARNAHRQR